MNIPCSIGEWLHDLSIEELKQTKTELLGSEKTILSPQVRAVIEEIDRLIASANNGHGD